MAAAPRLTLLLMVVLLSVLLVPPHDSNAQQLGLGPCPLYQAETLFTDQKIAELKGSGRYSVLLSHNPDLKCMSFDFIDDVRLSFNFKDMRRVDPVLHSERGRYTSHPTLYRKRGHLRVDMGRDGVLGSNLFGPVDLIPLLFTDTYEVWVTCTGLIAVHFEHVFVLVHEPVSVRTSDQTTSTNSSLVPSASEYESIASAGGGVSPVASSGLETNALIQDNFIKGSVGSANFSVKRDAAGTDGLITRTGRQALAADIRDDLIARGFPHANALRLKYDNCVD